MKTRHGFTLIELVISMFLASLLLTGFLQFFVSQSTMYSSNDKVVRTVQTTRYSMVKLVNEMRMAGYKTVPGAFVGVATATSTSFRFLADLNLDGAVFGDTEDVTITYSTGNKTLSKNGNTVLNDVEAFLFSYTLVDGSITSTPADLSAIRKINISLTMRSDKLDILTKTYKTFNLQSDVTPRNLGI